MSVRYAAWAQRVLSPVSIRFDVGRMIVVRGTARIQWACRESTPFDRMHILFYTYRIVKKPLQRLAACNV